jgi:hypothetical protein
MSHLKPIKSECLSVLSAKEYQKLFSKRSKSRGKRAETGLGARLIPKKAQGSGIDSRSLLERRFYLWWNGLEGPDLACNYEFHPMRNWRFDFAHVDSKIAIEIEGGSWVNGAHNRGKHFESDCEKYNEAAYRGWTVLRLTGNQIRVPTLERLIEFIAEHGKFVK